MRTKDGRIIIDWYTDDEGRRRPITAKKGKSMRSLKKLRKMRRGLFKPYKWKYLADIVTFKSIGAARDAAEMLLEEFEKAETRAKKRRVKAATVYAANRAKAAAKKKNLSAKERRELLEISEIYREAAEKMVLPPKE